MNNLSTKEILLCVVIASVWLGAFSWFRNRLRKQLAAQGKLEELEKRKWISTVLIGIVCAGAFLYLWPTLPPNNEPILVGGIVLGLGIVGYGFYQRWKAGQQ